MDNVVILQLLVSANMQSLSPKTASKAASHAASKAASHAQVVLSYQLNQVCFY